jgi:hypothetical protein
MGSAAGHQRPVTEAPGGNSRTNFSASYREDGNPFGDCSVAHRMAGFRLAEAPPRKGECLLQICIVTAFSRLGCRFAIG